MCESNHDLAVLFENNRRWAEKITKDDPNFFATLAQQQAPHYLWIGCADSRVPANQIVGLEPGQVFVHRNVANLVVHSDVNCLSVLQYAVEVLKVRHIIVCGHYGCGGVRAALAEPIGTLIDSWLAHIGDVYRAHRAEVDAIEREELRVNRLCELNVQAQVENVANTFVVQRAWKQGQKVTIHGVIYSVEDGILRDLGMARSGCER